MITNHNRVLTNEEKQTSGGCDCRGGAAVCPFQGNCKAERVAYCATVKNINPAKEETYTGLTDGTFKKQYNSHMSTMTDSSKRHATRLSTLIWKVKDIVVPFTIKLKIVDSSQGKPQPECVDCV